MLGASAYVALSRVTVAGTRLLILLLLAVAWGPEVQGAYAVAIAATSMSALILSSGVEVANGYYAATLGIRRAQLVHSLVFGAVLGAAAGTALYVLFPHVPFLSVLTVDYRLPLAVSVAPMVLQILLNGILVGPGLFQTIFHNTVVGSAAQGLIAVVVLMGSLHASLIFVGFTAGNLLMFGLAFAAAWKKGHGPLLDVSLAGNTMKYSGRAYPLNLLNWGAFRIDLLLIAWFRSAGEAGVYALASSLAEGLLYIGKSAAPALFSARARGRSETDGEIAPSYRIVGLLTVVAGVLVLSGFGFVVLPVLSDAYVLALPVLALLCAAMLPMAMHTLASWELAGIGRPQRAVPGAVAAVTITLTVAPPAILQVGILGAAAVSIVAYTTASIFTLRALAPKLTSIALLSCLRPRRSDLRGVISLAGPLRAAVTSDRAVAGKEQRYRR